MLRLELPGLFDLQVNGFGGVDFNAPSLSAERCLQALERMRTTGVTRCLPTLITSSFEQFAASARVLARLADASVAGQVTSAVPVKGGVVAAEGRRLIHLDPSGKTRALAAARHSRCPVVTASVDSMTFLHPVHIGQLIILKSAVNRVFRTSMEVGVKVWVEDLRTGVRRHTSSAYLTFVALGPNNERVPVAPVVPETEAEKRRYEAALVRREYRLSQKKVEKP